MTSVPIQPGKGTAMPLKRTARQTNAALKRAAEKAAKDDLAVQTTKADAAAAQLAQIVNLHIAGMSLAEIGTAIGASPEEVDRMLANDAARYVRSQPALRVYVRNYISAKYTELLDTVWTRATDPQHPEMLEHQDRAVRVLKEMTRLHGAEAPVQTEVKVEAAPETIDAMVAALAAQAGQGYDDSVFDVQVTDTGTEFTPSPQNALAALEQASKNIEEES